EATYKKMFGEYMVYVDGKPVFTVCDNTVFVKEVKELADIMTEAERGYPYNGAKEHYILDIENTELVEQVVKVLKQVIPVPKKKIKKA
ncbi:MAG: transcriptional regulator, partial [Clostridia bacterium]|nr:transcriptional regulator [Clostridia bacterium]